jgi:hypothetical protein
MAKVLGTILTIFGGFSSLFVLFLYLNSSAVLPYNPADKPPGLLDLGLALPAVFAVLILVAGVTILKTSYESNDY